MMSSHSTPNLQQPGRQDSKNSIYSYLHNQSGLNFAPVAAEPQQPVAYNRIEDSSPPPAPPVRDASSLKNVKYGPGHEKFPSWPVAAAAEAPQVLRAPPSGGSHRSKSWTDHTNYPKEKVIAYTRPYMKRPNSQQKLKTVLERCEKIPPETYESRREMDDRLYLPRVDREGKALGDFDYMVPSPPERDISKPQLSQKDLEEYARSYQDQSYQVQLTQADLEEYTRSYEEALNHQHQKQPSYAQSEGYHSYVSSTDSMSTPFLDRLRRDSEAVVTRTNSTHGWDEPPERDAERHEGRDSVVTTSSGSASSSETLKWHGSMSDVSVASSSCAHSNSSRQLIAHSARVQTPQRHNSESVLYIGPAGEQHKQEGWKERETRNNHHNKLRLFAVNTYTVQPDEQSIQTQPQNQHNHRMGPQSPNQTALSVADRVSELERQQTRYTYLDPEKRHRVSDPTLKAIQKKALLSFYERHHSSNSHKSQSWRSEPQLAQSIVPKPQSPPPQPPPRPRAHPTSRRASSASDYAKGAWRETIIAKRETHDTETLKDLTPRHQHSNSCGSLSNDLLGPVIMGPSISIDDWVPERPPKKPHLRSAFPDLFQDQRVPSPDLPPPSPPTVLENEVFNCDEPLPPPPPELENTDWQRPPDRLQEKHDESQPEINHTRQRSEQQFKPPVVEEKHEATIKPRNSPPRTLSISKQCNMAEPQVRHSITGRNMEIRTSQRHRSNSLHPTTSKQQRSPNSEDNSSGKRNSFIRSASYEKERMEQTVGYATHRQIPTERASMRQPPTQKLLVNGRVSVAISQKVHNNISGQFRAEPLRPHHLYRTREESNNSRPAPQVPVSDDESMSRCRQRTSMIESPLQPPPLQPRQSKSYQSMRRHEESQRLAHGIAPKSDIEITNETMLPNHQMSQSKASYLAYRRDRERGQPDADHGSYKRTMSPGGHGLSLDCASMDCDRISTSPEDKWSSNTIHRHSLIPKDTDNNNSLLHRLSLGDKKDMKESKLSLKKSDTIKSPQCNLPDVLPVSAKISPPRTLPISRPIIDVSAKQMNGTSPNRSPKEYYRQSSPKCSPRTSKQTTPQVSPKHSPTTLTAPQICTENGYSPSSPSDRTSINTPPIPSERFSLSSTSTSSDRYSLCNTGPTERFPISNTLTSPPDRSLLGNKIERSSSTVITTNLTTSSCMTGIVVGPRSTPNDEDTPPKSPLVSPPHSPEPPKLPTPESSPIRALSSSCNKTTASPADLNEITPQVIEGLQLIQRTEVVLRVNTCTSDAASQTEQRDGDTRTPLPARRKLQEEIDCERLSRDLANQLSPSDRLKGILVPAPEHKKPTDYVSGLFKLEVTSRPRPSGSSFRSLGTSTNSSPSTPPASPTMTMAPQNITKQETSTTISEPSSPLSATSTYFTTSESKAKFLTRYSRDMTQYNGVQDTKDLNQKKEELMNRLDRKLEVLRSEQLVVSEESRVNESLGENVSIHVSRLARPQELAKYRLHVEEVGKITSLLLGLSGRLARAENALMGLASDHAERKILESKRDKLQEQLEEAKKLKENIDRRSVNVSNILYKYLNSEEYADYDHFINMKAKLIMDAREIGDKIKLGEEQLTALRETLTISAT